MKRFSMFIVGGITGCFVERLFETKLFYIKKELIEKVTFLLLALTPQEIWGNEKKDDKPPYTPYGLGFPTDDLKRAMLRYAKYHGVSGLTEFFDEYIISEDFIDPT